MKKNLLLTIASLLFGLASNASFAAVTSYQIHIDKFPTDAKKIKSVFFVSQAGHDVPDKNPNKKYSQFDILPYIKKPNADITVPVLADQKDLAATEFDVASLYEMHTDLGKRYLLVDCPNMVAGQVNNAVEMKISLAQSQFVANEILASFKDLMSKAEYQKSEAYLTNAIQNFLNNKVDVRVCSDDRGGIFDINAPVSNAMSKEVFSQIGKLAKQWWYA